MNSGIRIENAVKIVTYVIGTIGFLSVFRYIGLIYSLSFWALFIFSVWFEQRRHFFLPRWGLNIISSGVIIATFMRLTLDDPVTPSLEALIILLAIKFLEEKRFRDYMQIYVITVFLLSGHALVSLDMIFLLYFLALVFLVNVAIILLTYYSQDPDMELERKVVTKIVYKSLLIPLISIPVTAFMFVILPRTNYPFFDFLNRGEKAKTGFTDNVRLGAVSDIQEDTSTIFRANMDKIDDNMLYWRGIVLDYFDGVSWHPQNKEEMQANSGITVYGNRTTQTIYLEPYENRFLFGLDKPVSVLFKNVATYDDLTSALSHNIDRRIKYDVTSVLSDTLGGPSPDKGTYLQLPSDLPQDISGLAKSLTAGDTGTTIAAMMQYLKGGRYTYSLKNLPVSKSPLSDFLFKYRYGNCEYFASSMAVMLRTAGIPSRVVGGYRGGYYNTTGRYYLVLQKNAHVWVEAYIDGRGWVRLDPTPASIESFTSSGKRNMLFRIRLLLDAVDYYWNASIIGYNLEKQFSLINKFRTGFRKPDIRLSSVKKELGVYLAGALIVALITFMAYRLLLFRKSEEEKIMELFAWKMKKYGYERKKSEGLEEFVSSIVDAGLREKARRFAAEFEKSYYKDRKLTSEESSRLKQIIKEL